jgi:hypothetical protein
MLQPNYLNLSYMWFTVFLYFCSLSFSKKCAYYIFKGNPWMQAQIWSRLPTVQIVRAPNVQCNVSHVWVT